MNVIGNKYKFLTLSGLLVLGSVVALVVFGLRQGIDFTGGALWQVKIEDVSVNSETLGSYLREKLSVEDALVTPQPETSSFLVRLKETSEPVHQKYLEQFKNDYPASEELQFVSIGPTIGGELRDKAVWAFLLVILGISLYVAYAFRQVSYPVSSWKYGVITLVTLFHDAIIPAGMFAVLGKLWGAEIDSSFVVAVLVVMGFSVHDTIVVFDRIRENLRMEKNARFDFNELVNRSVNETMARSVNTSLTLVLVLVALLFFGAPALKYFVLTILVGTVVGTYSSIFIASPLLTMWRRGDNMGDKQR